MIFITVAITYAGILINISLDENQVNPITTTIESKPTNEVPFPAVTIGSGQIMNPFGYLRRSQNQINASHFPEGNFDSLNKIRDCTKMFIFRNEDF